MWQRRGQVTLRHVHAARGNRARCGAMGVALASGVNVMLTRLPISHLRHLRPHVSLYCFRPKSAHNFLFSATRRWSRTSLLRCQPRRRDRTRRMRRRSCRCRRGPSAWRRVPAGCAWFPSHAPCGVSASPACSPPVVRARRVPTASRADEVHGGDTPPGHTAPSQAVLAAARPPGTVDGHQSLQCGEAPGGGPEVLPGLPPRSLLCWGPFDVEPGAPVSSSGGRRGQARRPGSVTADVLVTPARRRGSEQVPTL